MTILTPVTDGLGYIQFNTVISSYSRFTGASASVVREVTTGNRQRAFAYYNLAAYQGRRIGRAWWDFAGSSLVGSGDIAAFVRTVALAGADADIYNDAGSASPFATYTAANANFKVAFSAAALAAAQAVADAGGVLGLGQLWSTGSGTRQLTVGQGAAAAGAPALLLQLGYGRRTLLGVGR